MPTLSEEPLGPAQLRQVTGVINEPPLSRHAVNVITQTMTKRASVSRAA